VPQNSLRALAGAALEQLLAKSDNASALARADPEAAFLAAAQIAPAGCRLARGRRGVFFVELHERSRKAGAGRLRRASEAPRSTGARDRAPQARHVIRLGASV